MGQSKWASVCALILGLGISQRVIAQQADPFGDVSPTAEAAPAKENPNPPKSSEATCSASEARERIERILCRPLTEPLDFVEQPLREVVQVLSDTYDIPIQFDTAALDAVAASPDVEVTIQISNISLRSALDLMLRNAGAEALTYMIDKEVLLVTTQEESQQRLEVKVYRVDDLIGNGATPSPYGADAELLIDLIVASVERESWQENGTGEGEIKPFPPGMIVISQTHRVQEQVQALLDDLRRTKDAVEAISAEGNAQAAVRPVSRSITIDDDSVSAEGASEKIREALITSVDWNLAGGEITDDQKLLTVLNDRVLVRHLPQIVAQVEQSVKDFDLARRRSGGNGGGRGRVHRGGGF
jgi:hypothetical protein